MLASLPMILASDGSSEGRVRLFLLYSSHLCSFVILIGSVLWTAWLLNRERKKGHWQMLRCSNISAIALLSYRLLAIFSIVLMMGLLVAFGTGWGLQRLLSQSPEADREVVQQRLREVRAMTPIQPKEDQTMEDIKVRSKELRAVNMPAGKVVSFRFPNIKASSQPILTGTLGSDNRSNTAQASFMLSSLGRPFWQQSEIIVANLPFRLLLPPEIFKLSDVELYVVQDNDEKKSFFLSENSPLLVSTFYGSFYANAVRAALLYSLIALSLLSLCILLSQFFSFQGNLLITFLFMTAAYLRENIISLLFEKPALPAALDHGKSMVEWFYEIFWRPLLFFIPDYSNLNPAARLSNGELISMSDFLSALTHCLPQILACWLILAWGLRRQEAAVSIS